MIKVHSPTTSMYFLCLTMFSIALLSSQILRAEILDDPDLIKSFQTSSDTSTFESPFSINIGLDRNAQKGSIIWTGDAYPGNYIYPQASLTFLESIEMPSTKGASASMLLVMSSDKELRLNSSLGLGIEAQLNWTTKQTSESQTVRGFIPNIIGVFALEFLLTETMAIGFTASSVASLRSTLSKEPRTEEAASGEYQPEEPIAKLANYAGYYFSIKL